MNRSGPLARASPRRSTTSAEVHGAIRRDLTARFKDEGEKMRILYGGSVKPENAKALMAVENVNGALVGGASLKAADFLAIIRAYHE